ncbi:MAG: thiamine pyrophosphate-binding protein [Pseudonocardiaceae bacterium]
MILSDYVHERLHAAGVTHAFGVPGYFVMPVWQTFTKEPGIILARHESGAVFMADGFSRLTGHLGVVLATIGPGMTNCVTGVACAYRDSIPLLVITGQAPTATFGRGAFLESYILDRAVHPAGLFSAITKKSIEIVDSANAAFLVDAAIRLAQSGRPGPVHLSIPIDLQKSEIRPPSSVASRLVDGKLVDRHSIDAEVIRQAGQLLTRARRPLLLVGWGAMLAGAMTEIARLADELGAGVICSAKAVSCLSRSHSLRLGHLGPGQRPDMIPAVRAYNPDVVLVLGASLSSFYAEPLADLLERAAVIRVDIDADQLHLRGRTDLALHGDVGSVVSALRNVLSEHVGASLDRSEILNMVTKFQARGRRARSAQPSEFEDEVSMSGTIVQLSEMLPDDAVVIPDTGNHWLDTLALHEAPQAGGLQLNCGMGAMGWAIGAAVGMAFARPERRTVCVTGDGSMLMHGSELSVAAEHGLNLLALVFNNRAHGRVRLGQKRDFDGDPLATDIPEIDFAKWMEAMRVPSRKIDRADQVRPVLRSALDTPGTVGVEVRCHPDEIPASLRNWTGDVP